MNKKVVIPAAVAIGGTALAIGGAILTNKILAKSKIEEVVPPSPPSQEEVAKVHSEEGLTPTQQALKNRDFWRV